MVYGGVLIKGVPNMLSNSQSQRLISSQPRQQPQVKYLLIKFSLFKSFSLLSPLVKNFVKHRNDENRKFLFYSSNYTVAQVATGAIKTIAVVEVVEVQVLVAQVATEATGAIKTISRRVRRFVGF